MSLKGISVDQYNEFIEVVEYLNNKFSNISTVDIEVVLFDALPYMLEKYDASKSSWSTFVSRAAFNKLISFAKRNSKQLNKLKEVASHEDDVGSSKTVNINVILLADEFFDKLETLIMNMELEDINIFYLWLQGHSMSHIARVLGRNRLTISRKRDSILQVLRDNLSQYGELCEYEV